MTLTLREESVCLLTKDSKINDDDQERISRVIQQIFNNIPQLNSVMEVMKDQFKSLYRPLAKQLKKFFKGNLLNAVDEDNQINNGSAEKIENVGNVIDQKIE